MGCLENNYQTALHTLDNYMTLTLFAEELGNIYLSYKVINK